MAAASATPSRHFLSGMTGFALVSLPVIGIAAVLLQLLFHGPGDARAIWIAAAVAYVTQLAGFPAVRKMMKANFVTGWAVGSLVRLGTLMVFTLIGAFVLDLQMTPALLGLALFYFVSMLIEPLFLRS